MNYLKTINELCRDHLFFSLKPEYGGSRNPKANEIGTEIFNLMRYLEKDFDCEEHY